MPYEIHALDSSEETSAILTGLVEARLIEKINSESILTVETVERREWDYLLPSTTFLRVISQPDGDYSTYRVTGTTKSRAGERPGLIATARHIIADTMNEVFAAALDCVNFTPEQLADSALAYSGYDTGTVEPTDSIPFVRFEYETVWDCLLRICSLTGGELQLDEESGEIDILNAVGGDNDAVLRYGYNLKGASRSVDTTNFANRIYGVGGGSPPLTLTGATSSGGNKYVDDTPSITLYGLHESTCHEPTLNEVINLVATPAFDGVYTSGLCANWTNTGATVSENTNGAYCLYGRSSQRVQTSADSQGVSQSVTVSAGTVYSVVATVFITSGTVRIRVDDGTSVYNRAAAVTGTGLATVRIENWKANNSAVTVKIIQEGAGTADFYVDSVQIAAGASAKPFTAGKSADILYERAMETLTAVSEPEISYEVDLVDLYGDVKARSESDKFSLGDTVTVLDPVLDLDVTTRIMERDCDILHPWRIKVRLDNPSRGLNDTLQSIRKAQEDGLKRTRMAMAENSTAAETGSSRLGFSGLAFRFFSTITASSWNSISWNAGTLRVGDGYYAIASGSATGLSANSTYYFYFDRTSPTTFGNTTTSSLAETDDRILVFTVTTTSSPTLCKIYPMGVVHV